MKKARIAWYLVLTSCLITACVTNRQTIQTGATDGDAAAAVAFVESAESRLLELGIRSERAQWVYQNFITEDTEQMAAAASEAYTAAQVEMAAAAARFNNLALDYDTRRKLDLLRTSITMPAPGNAGDTAEMASLAVKLEGMYGRGEYCPSAGDCLDLGQMTDIMAESRDANQLLDIWSGWRTVSPPMKELYLRQTELANQGAAELGFAELGHLWRSGYDMDPDAFATELDRLWGQVSPLYEALHCHVRAKLQDHYGADVVPSEGPVPAHLLGNMWAQSWINIYPLVEPQRSAADFDLTALIVERDYQAEDMVKTGEQFFSSLGFEPLPDTFWTRSLFLQPADRDVVCHASAWDLDGQDDLRIKMCIKINAEDFQTIHHELGHNYYQRAYKEKSYLYQDSANDGFHEAVGDTVGLSITPEYLQQIGLLENVPDSSGDIDLLMFQALEKVAFLPFGLLVDQWRWKVFSGEVEPAQYNSLWWQLREKYQGVKAPVARPADAFDPGAKYHVPANVPYTRYFLAQILQFQFHRALCDLAGSQQAIHRCSIYGNKAAGERLKATLEMGLSRPWPDALEAMTGSRDMDGSAILDYFAPLKTWLDEQNSGRQCGW